MISETWNVYWSEYSADTYLYGSKIEYKSRTEVHFTNEQMPPATVIKRWYSKTNFQQTRVEPTLPMIDGEGSYELAMSIDKKPDEEILIRLVFYDKYDNEVGNLIVRDPVEAFKCPMPTYSYCMELINGGVSDFVFHYIQIRELVDEQEK